jgi:antiviral helicase SLH1
MWAFDHPLAQLQLPNELIYNINRYIDDYEIGDLIDMAPVELGKLIHLNERFGLMTRAAARQLPYLIPTIRVQPLAHDLLRVCVTIERTFDWVDRLHGRQEPFWLWVSDQDDREILRLTRLFVFETPTSYAHTFVVAVAPLPSKLHLRIVSERWLGSDDTVEIDLEAITMPPHSPSHLPLLDLPLLRLQQTENTALIRVFGQTDATLDPVMTQAFHSLFHSRASALFCVASASNWLLLLEMAIWCATIDYLGYYQLLTGGTGERLRTRRRASHSSSVQCDRSYGSWSGSSVDASRVITSP